MDAKKWGLEALPPYPWRFVEGEAGAECAHVLDAEGHDVAEFYSSAETITYQSRDRQAAAARLCSEAPALAAALLFYIGQFEALSSSLGWRESSGGCDGGTWAGPFLWPAVDRARKALEAAGVLR